MRRAIPVLLVIAAILAAAASWMANRKVVVV